VPKAHGQILIVNLTEWRVLWYMLPVTAPTSSECFKQACWLLGMLAGGLLAVFKVLTAYFELKIKALEYKKNPLRNTVLRIQKKITFQNSDCRILPHLTLS
jgi:hypothetical protein